MEMAREDPQQILSDDFASCGDFPENIVDKKQEEGGGVDNSALSEKSKVRSWIGASLWWGFQTFPNIIDADLALGIYVVLFRWAFYVLLVFIAYVCS